MFTYSIDSTFSIHPFMFKG
uniref:Uncharacterized protein n=1 Tax=Rhizophora mucronata TaxID=61149 RepID=A0A2P2PX66_RHIMU